MRVMGSIKPPRAHIFYCFLFVIIFCLFLQPVRVVSPRPSKGRGFKPRPGHISFPLFMFSVLLFLSFIQPEKLVGQILPLALPN